MQTAKTDTKHPSTRLKRARQLSSTLNKRVPPDHASGWEELVTTHRQTATPSPTTTTQPEPTKATIPTWREQTRDWPDKSQDPAGYCHHAEHAFGQLLTALTAEGPIQTATLIAEAAWRLDLSTQTINRYLTKWTCSAAPFKVHDHTVTRRDAP